MQWELDVDNMATVTLFRPVGPEELALIRESDFREFPPRLEGQPVFYPGLHEEYAFMIARNWNAKDPSTGYIGYVTRFQIRADYIARFDVHVVVRRSARNTGYQRTICQSSTRPLSGRSRWLQSSMGRSRDRQERCRARITTSCGNRSEAFTLFKTK